MTRAALAALGFFLLPASLSAQAVPESVSFRQKLRTAVDPWKGRIAVATEIISDSADRSTSSAELTLGRKWKQDEFQFKGRYDLASTNGVTTTDTLKVASSLRHDFNKIYFAQYRPTVEWNRAIRRKGVPNDYITLQQEIGGGVQLLNTANRSLRTGISENRFDTWNTFLDLPRSSRSILSAFEEVELKLPWQVGVSQRASWYPVSGADDGWESRIELNKKLTRSISVIFRHELRHSNPDATAPDYDKIRLLLGLDF